MSSLDEKRLARLYKLLKRMEQEKDDNTAAALRWAIFMLERTLNVKI